MGSLSTESPVSEVQAAHKSIVPRVVHCPATQVLREHTQEFEKKVYTVTEGVHVAVGYALANSILIEAPEGLIVVDTTEAIVPMKEIWEEFRKISDKPLKGVIYSHSHEDHTYGTSAILEDDGSEIEIWAHEKFLTIKETYDSLLSGVMLPRNYRQFGVFMAKTGGRINCGIGPFVHPQFDASTKLVWPNRFMSGKIKNITLAGLDLQLVHIPGETQCQMGVWIPSKKVFLPGDNFYRAFPNLYAIRGTVPRIVTCWIESLDLIRHYRPEHLVPAHTKPLTGQDYIFDTLTSYRDAIQFVHDQTLRLMNRGQHPVEIARSIKLPLSLQKVPFLQSLYGTPEWSSRAIFDAYVGWYSGAPEDMFPLTPSERGRKMVEAFRAETILNVAESAFAKGDHQWALELSSSVLHADPSSPKAKEVRENAILAMAGKQVSANGRNYFLTYLLEEYGLSPRCGPTAAVVFEMPVEFVFKRMAFEIKAEDVEGVVMTVVMTFHDLQQTFTLMMRNCVLEFEEKDSPERDLHVTLDLDCLRQIMAGQKTPAQLVAEDKVKVDDHVDVLTKFFSCFETGDEFLTQKELE